MEFWNNGWGKYDEGDINGAIKIWSKGVRFYPEDYNLPRQIGKIYIKLGNKFQAFSNFLQAEFWGDKKVINYLSSEN